MQEPLLTFGTSTSLVHHAPEFPTLLDWHRNLQHLRSNGAPYLSEVTFSSRLNGKQLYPHMINICRPIEHKIRLCKGDRIKIAARDQRPHLLVLVLLGEMFRPQLNLVVNKSDSERKNFRTPRKWSRSRKLSSQDSLVVRVIPPYIWVFDTQIRLSKNSYVKNK